MTAKYVSLPQVQAALAELARTVQPFADGLAALLERHRPELERIAKVVAAHAEEQGRPPTYRG